MTVTPQRQIDAYMAQQQELKRKYIAQGLSEEEADDKATNAIRRQIRNGPPILGDGANAMEGDNDQL